MADGKKGAAQQPKAAVTNQQQSKAVATASAAPNQQSKGAVQQQSKPAVAAASAPKSAAAAPKLPAPVENAGEGEADEYVCSGTVKWFNATRGFGFITPSDDGPEIFVHQTSIHASGFRSLREGEAVEYAVEIGDDGRLRAVSVTGPNGDFVQGDSGGRAYSGGAGGDGENAAGGGSGRGRGRGGRGRGGRGRGPSGDGRCFNCNQEGHFARDCTAPQAAAAAAGPRNQGCYACGEQGHFARDCPNQS